jgi:hypothetical protein
MSRQTKQDRILNECTRVRVGIAPIVGKMVESQFSLFEHVCGEDL